MHKRPKSCNSSLLNLAIHNHLHQFISTTQQQLASSTVQSNNNNHDLTENHKDILNSTGNPAKKTLVIIRQNIIQQKFISVLDHTTFTWMNPPLSYQELSSQALSKGVLKSLGIPTPRNPHYQIMANSCLSVTPSIPGCQVLGQP
jgi:hypothetical protein